MKKLPAIIFQCSLIIAIVVSVASCTTAQHSSDTAVLLPSGELKAGGLAYEAFKNTLAGQKVFDNELSRFASSIDNYGVSSVDNGDSYTFMFKIKLFHGRMLKDGWFTYVVNKADWSVRRIVQ